MVKNVEDDSALKSEQTAMNAITIDCVIFGFDKGSLEVLLVQHGEGISKGKWGLPGGWIYKKESTDNAAHRLLNELTGLDNIYL
jgi:ADP-ribose pyrophosphatase YjhB (NUDIX family)